MSAKTPKLLERPRNKLVFNPLLSKGGTHTKSKTGQRESKIIFETGLLTNEIYYL